MINTVGDNFPGSQLLFCNCQNSDSVFESHMNFLRPFGISGIMFGVCHSLSKAREMGLLNAVEVWTNYPNDYMLALVESGLGDVDFSSRCIVDFQRAFVWGRKERYEGITSVEYERPAAGRRIWNECRYLNSAVENGIFGQRHRPLGEGDER